MFSSGALVAAEVVVGPPLSFPISFIGLLRTLGAQVMDVNAAADVRLPRGFYFEMSLPRTASLGSLTRLEYAYGVLPLGIICRTPLFAYFYDIFLVCLLANNWRRYILLAKYAPVCSIPFHVVARDAGFLDFDRTFAKEEQVQSISFLSRSYFENIVAIVSPAYWTVLDSILCFPFQDLALSLR